MSDLLMIRDKLASNHFHRFDDTTKVITLEYDSETGEYIETTPLKAQGGIIKEGHVITAKRLVAGPNDDDVVDGKIETPEGVEIASPNTTIHEALKNLAAISPIAGEDGADGADGVDGIQGEDGLDAYEVWLEDNPGGTKEDYYADIKGEKGDKGDQGEKGEPGDLEDGVGDMNTVTYQLTAFTTGTVSLPTIGQVTIDFYDSKHTVRFHRYDSRGLDNSPDRNYSFFRDIIIGNPLMLIDTTSERDYIANKVGSVSGVVTGVSYANDILAVEIGDLDVTGGNSVSDLVDRVFSLVSAHQLGNQLDSKVDKPTSQLPPTTQFNRKLAGVKVNYEDIAAKIPLVDDEYSYNVTLEFSLSDKWISETQAVNLTIVFKRGTDYIYIVETYATYTGDCDIMSVRQLYTNLQTSPGGAISDLVSKTSIYVNDKPSNYNLDESSTFEYNFYSNATYATRAWAKLIFESDQGIVNFDSELQPDAEVLLFDEVTYYRAIESRWDQDRSRREFFLSYIKAQEIFIGNYKAATEEYVHGQPSFFLIQDVNDDVTVSSTVYASPGTNISAADTDGLVLFDYIGGALTYTGLEPITMDLHADITFSSTGTNMTNYFYWAKNWTSGSPSTEDLRSQMERKTSSSEVPTTICSHRVSLVTGDTLDVVVNNADSSQTISFKKGCKYYGTRVH